MEGSAFTGQINWVELKVGEDDHTHLLDPGDHIHVLRPASESRYPNDTATGCRRGRPPLRSSR